MNSPKQSEELPSKLTEQGAHALLAATYEFLRKNNISDKLMINFARSYLISKRHTMRLNLYNALVRTYDDMGVILATWFSDPRFLDDAGQPLPLRERTGRLSIKQLIKRSGAQLSVNSALRIMRESPSIKFNGDSTVSAVRRVFVLAKLDVPRAAFVVERYLDTLQQNSVRRKNDLGLFLERSCQVSAVDLAKIAPMLRDIDARGTAFMDSIDGEIESRRMRRSIRKSAGSLGVVVFTWTKPAPSARRKLMYR